MTPTNADLAQFAKAIQSGALSYGTDTGTANATAITLPQIPDTYPRLLLVKKGANANTGATTIAVNTLPVVQVITATGGTLTSGTWLGNAAALLVFDGTNYQLVSVLFDQVATRDFYLIDTPITKTVHGASPDFATLTDAFYWLSKYRITQTGSVIFNIRAGQFSYGATNLVFDHPNADRVTINGTTLLTAPITTTTFGFTGFSSTARATDRGTQLTALRAVYATELQFTGGAGIIVKRGGSIWNRLLITGDRTGSVDAALFYAQAQVTVGDISAANGGGAGIAAVGGGAAITVTNQISGSGCVTTGIAVSDSGDILFGNTAKLYGVTNDAYGIRATAGTIRANSTGIACSQGNGAHGIAGDTNGIVESASGSISQTNGGNGAYASSGRCIFGAGCTFRNNGQYGAQAVELADMVTPQSAFSGNTTGSAAASNMAKVNASGSTGVTGACSPAANTLGNQNSIVIV
ncbi:MAG TPA: hypothetical protein VGH62_01450 [Bradyrhizobium sp.]